MRGGAAERRVTDLLRSAVFSESAVVARVELLIESMMQPEPPAAATSAAQGEGCVTGSDGLGNGTAPAERDDRRHKDAESKLVHLAAEVLGGVVGRSNAKRGTLKLVRAFRCELLNRQLVYVLLDELIAFVFPEAQHGS
ncbi:hypothetical protein DFJ73DRAFT_828937 [Zopfochytrium polystomum]|nr:hypothetical protein DFJ73DRAFT_828937 [Zopfochytrium polystomum]